MSQRRPSCPKCGAGMELGAILDRGDGNRLNTAEWLEGTPETSIWSGLKTKGRERHPVQSYRCERCGYLESYAGLP